MKQVFLHIGTPKTGTTSLQVFLQKNKENLAKQGYLYPSQEAAHHNLAYTLTKHPKANYQSNTWEDIIEEIESKDLNKIIISSECFISSSDFVRQVWQKLNKYETKIIIYLKRQDLRFESSFSHQIRMGDYTGSVDFYLQNHLHIINYVRTLNRWGQVFGRENIIVRPLEKEQVPDLYQDFLESVNIVNFDGFERTGDRNIKPNFAQIVAINFINQKIATKLGLEAEGFLKLNRQDGNSLLEKYRRTFFKQTQHWQGKMKYNLIPYEQAVEILEKCQEANARIARRYLNRKDGRLFYQPLEQYEHDSLDLSNLTKEQSIDLCSYISYLFT